MWATIVRTKWWLFHSQVWSTIWMIGSWPTWTASWTTTKVTLPLSACRHLREWTLRRLRMFPLAGSLSSLKRTHPTGQWNIRMEARTSLRESRGLRWMAPSTYPSSNQEARCRRKCLLWELGVMTSSMWVGQEPPQISTDSSNFWQGWILTSTRSLRRRMRMLW